MKNDQAANIVRELVDQLSLNAEEALRLEQSAERVYELGYSAGQANYQRTYNPADTDHAGRSGRPIEAVQPQAATPRSQNPDQPTV